MARDPQLERLRAELARLVPNPGGSGTDAERLVELVGLFLANVPDFMVLFATDGTILFLNRARPGKTVAEVVGHNLFEYMHEGGKMRATVAHVVATGESVTLESSATYSDGTVHDFLTRLSPVFDGDRVVALASIATDVTPQKRAEAALRDSEEKLRVAIAATGMGLWSWNVRTGKIDWDEALCRIWGLSVDQVPKDFDTYIRTIHPDDRESLKETVSTVLRTGVYPAIEHRVVRPDGTVRRTMAKANVIRAEDGSVERMIGGVLDVTEQRELEERSRQAQKLEAIGQLSAGIAHNFNNMLTAILPNIELAMMDASPRSQPVLQAAREASLRAAELIRQLMTFAGRARPNERRATDVRALVERTVTMCRRAFDQKIELSVQIPPGEQLVVSDATQLEQALLNLLINARDAVLEAKAEPKRVAVEVERIVPRPEDRTMGLVPGRPYVCIRVTDNGVGMDAATTNRIYEPFFTTKDVGKGTGLGLSTARTIVQEHGGVLECETVRGAGSTFSLFLPVAESVRAVEEPAPFVLEKRGSHTILVVDDELPVREVVRRMLEHSGYTVHVAASGREALELLANDAFRRTVDLVLLDLSMPGMSGSVTRAEIGKLSPDLKVAYFSGHAVDASGDVVGVVEKPTTHQALIGRVREFLERPVSSED